MIDDKKTLGELLSDPRIGKIAADAIRNRDLSKEEVWNQYNIQKQSAVLLRLLSCAASTLQNRDTHGFSLDLRGSRSYGMKHLPFSS